MADKDRLILVICIVCIVAIWIVTPARCYVRLFLKKYFGWDDVLAVIATISFTLACLTMMYGSWNHVWRPFAEVTPETYEKGLHVFFVCKILYGLTTCIIKLCFCLTLLRIVKERIQLWTIYALIILTLSYSVFYLSFIITTCKPISFFWGRATSTDGFCRDPEKMVIATYIHGVLVFMVDFILAVIPVFMVRRLSMDPVTKLTVVCILALGSVASIATFVRIPYIERLKTTDDFVYKNIEIAIWSGLELAISIVSTGAATLRPLLDKTCLRLPAPSSSSNSANRATSHYSSGNFTVGHTTNTARRSQEPNPCTPYTAFGDLAGFNGSGTSLPGYNEVDLESGKDVSMVQVGILPSRPGTVRYSSSTNSFIRNSVMDTPLSPSDRVSIHGTHDI